MIEAKVANALALDYPRERLQIIVACDGSPDDTPALARAAGADLVLDLPHGGKMAAQNAAVEQATGELLAFSDANTMWEPDALRAWSPRWQSSPASTTSAATSASSTRAATNQEGLYWRYEMWLRARESALRSVTAGNGAIYAVDPDAYTDDRAGHRPRPHAPVPHRQARRPRDLRTGRARQRGDGPERRGRVQTQAPDDELRLADHPRRRNAASRGATGRSTRG